MRNHSSRAIVSSYGFLLALALCAGACRGPDSGLPGGPNPDLASPLTDGATPIDIALPADGPPGGFCQGPVAKVDSRGGLVAPATVTSSRLILNCCDGVSFRFHVESVAGVRPTLMIRGEGGKMPSGDFDLAMLPRNVGVNLFADDMVLNANLAGTVHIDVPGGQNDPIRVRACVTVSAPGTPLDGARLYTPDFPVMPWGWDERFTIKLLSDRSITAAQASQQPIGNLALAAEPLVRVSSLGFYEKSNHRGHWDPWSTTEALRNRVGAVGTQGVPFVVEAEGQRIYLGAFYARSSSQSFAGPVIVMDDLTADGFTIDPSYPPKPVTPDPRADPRILKALGESGKLAP